MPNTPWSFPNDVVLLAAFAKLPASKPLRQKYTRANGDPRAVLGFLETEQVRSFVSRLVAGVDSGDWRLGAIVC